ncbi:hypothetical protein N6H14_25485 [Paenibacillus sp. CC-CFT747]|nr:hypothetical protein N6H14_25485 [Paenibacillus sp. CC-CFT747]
MNREEASPAPAPTIVSEEALEAAGSGLSELLMTTTVQLNGRLDAMEHKLAEKAGTVVSVQLLQHRKELDELRSSLHQLSQYVEAIDKSLSHLQKLAEPAPVAAAYAGPPRTEKRKTLLASLLHL